MFLNVNNSSIVLFSKKKKKKKVVSSESGETYAQIQHHLWVKTIQNAGFWCERTTGVGLFHWRKRYYVLWIGILDRSDVLELIMDLFLANTQLLISQDINWWTEFVWVIVMFISSLNSHSDGIHSLLSISEQVM